MGKFVMYHKNLEGKMSISGNILLEPLKIKDKVKIPKSLEKVKNNLKMMNYQMSLRHF